MRPGYRLILAYTMAKFSPAFQLFDMKITAHGKYRLKNPILRSDLSYGDVQDVPGVQACPVGQHVPDLCGFPTFRHENHFKWKTWRAKMLLRRKKKFRKK